MPNISNFFGIGGAQYRIYYFEQVFEQPSMLSTRARKLIRQTFDTSSAEVKLSIPSIVFVEIFEKWFKSEEFAAKFHYEVFQMSS
jgi:hypothetical protein